MGYKINSVTGEMSEYIFDFGGILALRNFTARTNGNRLIIHSAENANFTILDALVNEVEIDGVVYDNSTAAQEALQRLVFNPAVPVVLTKREREIIEKFQKWTGKGLCDDEKQTLTANTPKSYKLPTNSKLFAIELLGDATIEVGTTEAKIGDLGEMTGGFGSVLNFGLLSVQQIWMRSTKDVGVIPIIYTRSFENGLYEFRASTTSMSVAGEGATEDIELVSKKRDWANNSVDNEYSVIQSDDWINVEKRKNDLRIVINKNNDKMRTGTIVLRQQGSGKTITITVRQVECVDGSIALAYTDTNLNGKYDKCLLTLTTTKDVATPSGWTKVNARKYTKEVTANGSVLVTVRTAEGATKELRADVSRIGDNSGLGLVVPAITDMQADRYTIHPTGGTGTYTYKWSITGCYDITTTTAKVVGIRCKPNGICESGVLTVVVSDGQNTIARNLTIAKSCKDTVKPTVSVDWGKTSGLAATEVVRLTITASDNITPKGRLKYSTTSSSSSGIVNNGKSFSPLISVDGFSESTVITVRVTDEAGNYTELQQEYRTRAAITTYEFSAEPTSVNIPCEGGRATVNIHSVVNQEGNPTQYGLWDVVNKPDWVQATGGNGGKALVITAGRNE